MRLLDLGARGSGSVPSSFWFKGSSSVDHPLPNFPLKPDPLNFSLKVHLLGPIRRLCSESLVHIFNPFSRVWVWHVTQSRAKVRETGGRNGLRVQVSQKVLLFWWLTLIHLVASCGQEYLFHPVLTHAYIRGKRFSR